MPHTALTPVFVGLRTGLHVLFFALAGLVLGRAVITPAATGAVVIALAAALMVTYAIGARLGRHGAERAGRGASAWVAALSVEWIVLVWLTSDAAYLAFPLFFLYLHVWGRRLGAVAIVLATAVATCAIGLHSGWSVGGVVGPIVGAGVALLIGLGYQALAREAHEREELVAELLATRDQLAATERESGVLAERARLAREIHDTVAQGLSSIHMLLYAAEAADQSRPGIQHIRLARATAAANLADTRRFIRELTPPQLDDQSLGGALRRLADTQWAAAGLTVSVRVSDEVMLPMTWQTALLRIAQGAIANVIQHAGASSASIVLDSDAAIVRFSVVDDGVGFDLDRVMDDAGRTDSFGLRATRERVQQLGGALRVDSAPGSGTSIVVELALSVAP